MRQEVRSARIMQPQSPSSRLGLACTSMSPGRAMGSAQNLNIELATRFHLNSGRRPESADTLFLGVAGEGKSLLTITKDGGD